MSSYSCCNRRRCCWLLLVVLQLLECTVAFIANDTTTDNNNKVLVVDIVSATTKGVPTTLDPEWVGALDEKDFYQSQEWDGTNGWGIVIQNIHAPVDVVWNTLLDFEAYPARISKVSRITPYHPSVVDVEAEEYYRTGRMLIFQRMTLVFRWFVSFSFNIRYQVYPSQHHLSWTLDPTTNDDNDGESVLTLSSGYWQVHEHPSRSSEWSLVIYRNQITLAVAAAKGDKKSKSSSRSSRSKQMPTFVQRFLEKQGLQEATRWLKPTSELQYRTGTWKKQSDETNAPLPPARESADSSTTHSLCNDNRTCPTTSPTTTDMETTTSPLRPEVTPSPIGVSRYLLVSTVWGLVVFNTYLYFSHYR